MYYVYFDYTTESYQYIESEIRIMESIYHFDNKEDAARCCEVMNKKK